MTDRISPINACAAIDAHVGRRLRARRLALSLGIDEIAERLSLSAHLLRACEEGAGRIGPAQIYALSRLLDVPVSYFFDGIRRELDTDFPGTPFADGGRMAPQSEWHQELTALLQAFLSIKDANARSRLCALAQSLADGSSEKG